MKTMSPDPQPVNSSQNSTLRRAFNNHFNGIQEMPCYACLKLMGVAIVGLLIPSY